MGLKDDKTDVEIAQTATIGVGAYYGARAAGRKTGRYVTRNMVNPGKDLELSTRDIKKVYATLKADKKDIRVKSVLDPTSRVPAPHYNPETNTAHIRNTADAAHELGHATSILNPKNKSLRLFSAKITAGIGHHNAGHIRGATGFLRGLEGKDNDSGDYSLADNFARVATGLGMFEEGQASVRGYNALRKVKGSEFANLSAKKILIPAYATYVANAAINHFAIPRIGNAFGQAVRKIKEELIPKTSKKMKV